MSIAISTALRLRNRGQFDSAIVEDAIADAAGNIYVRQLSNSPVALIDFNVSTHRAIRAGDQIAVNDADRSRITDIEVEQDSIAVSDSLIIEKSQSVTFQEFVPVVDAGFITDRDLIRQRVLVDSFIVDDEFSKSITKPDSVTVTRVVMEPPIDVDDSLFPSTSGVKQRTIFDELAVADATILEQEKTEVDAFAVTDSQSMRRLVRRILNEAIDMSDDIIVTRTAITRSEVIGESFAVTDRITVSFTSGAPVSALIEHGIENQ